MEDIIPADGPLAALLEGQGTADDSFNYQKEAPLASSPGSSPSSSGSPSFAPYANPRGPRLHKRFAHSLNLKQPLQSPIAKMSSAWSHAVNSTMGSPENERFLEHFRYLLIASQLLNEYPDLGTLQASSLIDHSAGTSGDNKSLQNPGITVTGVVATASIAFVLVLLIHFARGGRINNRLALLAIAFIAVAVVVFYAYFRRQWLKYLRHQAIDAATTLTTNIRGFELTTSAALSLIQEVELVSKGYRLSVPLPPISRIDDNKANRKCARLRRRLQKAYAAILPTFREAIQSLSEVVIEDDYERCLDIYDIPHHAITDALTPYTPASDDDDEESLKSLRLVSYQYTTLRRVILCSLMSLDASGSRPDLASWPAAVDLMNILSIETATWAANLHGMLQEVDQLSSPTTPKLTKKRANDRVRNQVRQVTTLSSGIRSLQAKMFLLREESNRAIDESEDLSDLSDLGPSLMDQYESIGADLKNLMATWENGKNQLAHNMQKTERRISMHSSGMRSPVSSLGGLTAVEEGIGGPDDALRALLGEGAKSKRSSFASSDSGSGEQVFEGLAIPRQRCSVMTREERIARMHDERAKQAERTKLRESNSHMMQELQSVIGLRQPLRRTAGARVTSV